MSILEDFNPEFEYSEECYQYLLQRERRRPQFHNRSPQLGYREELIKRIEILSLIYRLSLRVKFLSIYILDYFMDSHDICENMLELTAASSLVIAAKVDESDNKIPKLNQLLSDPNQYLKSETLEMETKILEFFDWVFLTPTAATYIDYFYIKCLPTAMITLQSRALVDKYLDKSLEKRFYKFNPSLIAASVIYCVRDRLALVPYWSLTAQLVTKYSYNQIQSCVHELRKYEFITVPKKYCLSTGHHWNVTEMSIFGCDKC